MLLNFRSSFEGVGRYIVVTPSAERTDWPEVALIRQLSIKVGGAI